MTLVKILNNSILLLKLSLKLIFQEKKILVDTLLYVVFNLLVYIFYSLIIYLLFGIHIFDLKVINIVKYFTIGGHITHAVVVFSLVLICSWVTLIGKFSTVYSTIRFLQGKKARIFEGIVISSEKIKDVSTLSMIYTLDILQSIVGIIGIIRQKIIQTKKELQGYDVKQESEILNFLDIPLIVYEDKNVHQAIKESERLMKSNFGDKASFTFSMLFFSLIVLVVILIFFSRLLVHYFGAIISFNVSLILALILWGFLSTSISIFKAVIYNYCNNKPIGVFDGHIDKLVDSRGNT